PGEAMMAKRRSYATIISHLTPPLMASQLNSAQNQFAELFKKYHETREPLKSQYAEAILKLATEKGYTKDLNLAEGVISDENMLKLINYIENLETETITSGLYTLGKPYTDHKIDETVVLMSANAIAYCRARLDKIQRKIKNEEIDNKTFFRIRYLKPAEDIVKKILTNAGVKNSIDTLSIITESEKQRYFKWLNFSKAKLRSNERFSSNQVGSYTSLEHLLIKVIVEPQKKEFISNLISERTFERTYSLLDNEKFKKAERVSRFVPEMRNTIALMKDSNLRQLIKMMRDTVVRKEVFRLVSAGLLDDKITKEKELQAKYAISVCNQPLYRQFLSYNDGDFKRMSFYQLAAFEDVVHFLEQKKGLLLEFCKKNPSENCNRLSEFFENKFSQIQKVWNEEYEQKKELEQDFASIVEQLIISANSVKYYKESLFKSPSEEIKSMFEFLSGGYISPGPGGDPITNPASIPSGKNLYAVNAELTPSKEAWKLGVKLVDKMLSDFKNKHKVYPKKVALTLWSSEFIETEGATIAQAFYLLGVEPIWDAFGRIQDLKLISHHDLKRPRIDIVVQTSGQLRDLAASRLFLIHKAIQLAANDKASPENYVNEGIRKAEAKLIKNGFSPKEAKEYAQYRVFGGVNGNYGTGIMSLVEKGDAWDSISQIAQTYINNMGAIYSEKENFGFFRAGIFEAALENTEAIIQPRQSNTWGPLSLDHVYEFMGGISSAVTKVTGKEPEAYFADYRNPFNMQIQGLKEAIWTETRTTITNPRYIKEYMKGEGTSAETFAETFRNIFGWGALKSSVIEQRLWDDLYDTYVLDKQKLGIHQFFEAKNPYALQEITAVMLEAIRKGIWKATDQQRDKILQLHTNLIKNYDAACSEFVCNNRKLISFVKTNLSKSQAFEYESKLSKELSGTSRESMVLSKKQDNNQDKKQTYNNSFNFNFLLSLFLGALVFIIAVALFFKFKK
ncbi:MAG: cobaltochelatase subunit CobN, partial [Bacteroidales bacterium]|nr:cobaltochelatase subunit CobN [Bacteroidales bacterium]